MTTPEPQASLVIFRALPAAATPEQLRRLIEDIHGTNKDAA